MLTLDDETDNFCSASQMRKSHSIDTSYLYEEATSTFTEAVNPKIHSNQGNMTTDNIRNTAGATNLCKSKSEYNLAFASPTRSGKIIALSISQVLIVLQVNLENDGNGRKPLFLFST